MMMMIVIETDSFARCVVRGQSFLWLLMLVIHRFVGIRRCGVARGTRVEREVGIVRRIVVLVGMVGHR